MQPFAHADGGVRELIPANAVFVPRVNALLGDHLFAASFRAKYFFNKFLDHSLSLSCRNNWPAIRLGMCLQAVIGVYSDRMSDCFHQGEVVMRVAVKIAAVEIL